MSNAEHVKRWVMFSFFVGHCRDFKMMMISSVVALLAVSCGSLQTQGFRNPSTPTSVADNPMMVVAMDDRASIRDAFEAQVVAELQPHNVTAYISNGRFQLAELKGSHEQVRQKLAAAKVGTVLITRVADRSSSVERGGLGRPISGGDYNWNDLSEARYQLYTSGGEIQTDVRLESKLFRVADGAVLWIGYTDTVLKEDYDPDVLIRSIAHAVVTQLASDKLIP